MNKSLRKLLTALLCVAMVFSSISVIAFAEDTDVSEESQVKVDLHDELSDESATEGEAEAVLEENTEEPQPPEEEPEPPHQVTAPTVTSCTMSGEISSMKAKIRWTCEPDADKKLKYKARVWKYKGSGTGTYNFVEGKTVNLAKMTSSTSRLATVTGVYNWDTYYYQIGAYLEGDDVIAWTKKAKLNTRLPLKAAKITSISGGSSKDNLITIKWTKGKGSSKYALLRGVTSEGKTVVKKNPGTTVKYNQPRSGYCYYRIRSYSSECPYVYRDSDYKKGGKVGEDLIFKSITTKMKWTAKMRKSAVLYKGESGSARYSSRIPKGTKTTAIGYTPSKIKDYDTPSRIKVRLSDGKEGWVKYSCVKIKAVTDINRDYPVSVKEAFANNYESDTKYLVWVNQYTQRYTLFKKNSNGKFKQTKTARVTTGKYYQPLKYGSNYYLNKRSPIVYRVFEDGRVYYFNYATYFRGSGYFHTRSIWLDTGKYRNGISKKPTTRGCVRMYDGDAKTIYGLPLKTKVVIR